LYNQWLIWRARRGDDAAWETLYQRAYRQAFRVALHLVREPGEAAALTAAALVTVRGNLDRVRTPVALRTYVYGLLARQVQERWGEAGPPWHPLPAVHHGAVAWAQVTPSGYGTGGAPGAPANARGAPEAAVGRQGAEDASDAANAAALRLAAAVGRLPLRLRLPVLLCAQAGLPRGQAAQALATDVGTLDRRLAEARALLGAGPGQVRRALAAELNGYEPPPELWEWAGARQLAQPLPAGEFDLRDRWLPVRASVTVGLVAVCVALFLLAARHWQGGPLRATAGAAGPRPANQAGTDPVDRGAAGVGNSGGQTSGPTGGQVATPPGERQDDPNRRITAIFERAPRVDVFGYQVSVLNAEVQAEL
jgi:DNA-directed RNA polymerase specialized sigma24 family protein